MGTLAIQSEHVGSENFTDVFSPPFGYKWIIRSVILTLITSADAFTRTCSLKITLGPAVGGGINTRLAILDAGTSVASNTVSKAMSAISQNGTILYSPFEISSAGQFTLVVDVTTGDEYTLGMDIEEVPDL